MIHAYQKIYLNNAQNLLLYVPNIANAIVNHESNTNVKKYAWLTNDHSTWYLAYTLTNTLVKNAWVYTGYDSAYGWHHFGHNGIMDKGWLNDSGYTYYLDQDGKMLTGQHNINGKTYTFAPNGILIS